MDGKIHPWEALHHSERAKRACFFSDTKKGNTAEEFISQIWKVIGFHDHFASRFAGLAIKNQHQNFIWKWAKASHLTHTNLFHLKISPKLPIKPTQCDRAYYCLYQGSQKQILSKGITNHEKYPMYHEMSNYVLWKIHTLNNFIQVIEKHTIWMVVICSL